MTKYLSVRSLAVLAAAAAGTLALVLWLLLAASGATVLASARCAGQLLKLDRAAYQACFDVEREQILEERQRGHTRFDE